MGWEVLVTYPRSFPTGFTPSPSSPDYSSGCELRRERCVPVSPRIVLMPRSGENWALGREAMGAILEKNARARTVYLFVPVVERTLGYAVDGKMLHDGRKAMTLARALARVLAHETVHAIDSDIPHGPEGSVMTANLTSALLLGHRLSFHESTAACLQKRFGDTPSTLR